MARVTKINVGGTNYDIAHEGELKNSGFEVVTSLPTTNLFVGRQVMYNGQLYVYNGSQWVNVNTPYEANLLWGGRNIASGFSPIDAGMVSELSANLMAFPNPAGITVEYSRDGGVTWLDYEAQDYEKIYLFTSEYSLYCGKSGPDNLAANVDYMLRVTINPMECGLYAELNKAIIKISRDNSLSCWCTISALTQTDYNLGNMSDDFYKIFANKVYINGWPGYNVLNFGRLDTSNTTANDTRKHRLVRFTFGYDDVESYPNYYGLKIFSIKLFGLGRFIMPSNLARTNHLYRYDSLQNAFFPAKVESKEVINFDVNNIEPTQTGNVTKTSTWLWQYLVQGVNWLKANKVALSVYNAKVAELEQADTDNNASIQSVSTDLTELSNGLATVATSGSYNDLTDKPTFSGSYNDLTDTPTLAAVATSGDYNDLLNRPAFSGSYNDLTDTPTLAAVATSGDYNDLLNRPAFSGSYNDLTDTPTIPNSFADLNGNIDAANQISDGSIANSKLANSSMMLNGITVSLGGQFGLPWQISWNSTLYKARIMGNWLQIYHNNQWVDTFYLLRQEPIQPILPTNVVQITSLDDLSWYNEQVSEYEIDSNTTFELLDSKVSIAAHLLECTANQLTLNLYPIPSRSYSKGALDAVIADLQKNNFAVFVENDLDTILSSGNDFCVRIKISKVPTYKAIIECYIAR